MEWAIFSAILGVGAARKGAGSFEAYKHWRIGLSRSSPVSGSQC